MTASTVDRSALILGAELGKGGEGRVYSVTAPKFGRPTAYKEYRSGAHIDRPALDRLLDLYAGFDRPQQKDWLERFAWPIQPVQNGSATTGFLMPEVPEHFFTDWLRGTTHTRRIAEFQHLLNTPDFITQRGITLTRRHQYQLLTHLAETLQLLHNHHLAVGDLSPKNLLFNLTEPTATVYLIDCDTITHRDNPRKHHVETPGWGLPTNTNGPEPTATPASDAYKFGLLALRLLAGSQNTTTVTALPDDAATLRELIRRSLDPDPRHRPMPADWIPTLRVATNRATRETAAPRPERTRFAAPDDRRHHAVDSVSAESPGFSKTIVDSAAAKKHISTSIRVPGAETTVPAFRSEEKAVRAGHEHNLPESEDSSPETATPPPSSGQPQSASVDPQHHYTPGGGLWGWYHRYKYLILTTIYLTILPPWIIPMSGAFVFWIGQLLASTLLPAGELSTSIGIILGGGLVWSLLFLAAALYRKLAQRLPETTANEILRKEYQMHIRTKYMFAMPTIAALIAIAVVLSNQ